MKKILGISIVAVLAVTPLMASAATAEGKVTLVETNQQGQVAATNDVASTSYVKGAYNVLGNALNAIDTRVDDLETTVGDSSTGLVKDVTDLKTTVGNSTSGLVKDVADLKSGSGIAAGSIGLTQLASDVQTSLGKADTALQASDITTGTTDGTIKVGNTDVAVHGLGSAAYENTTAFDAAGAAAGVQSAIEGKFDDGATGYDINAKSLQVQGANVLTENSTIAKTQLASDVQTSLGKADTALQASDISSLQSTVSGHTTSIGALETAVGDSNTGLVHNVAALDAAINDQTTGLGKQVSDNTTAISNITDGTTTVGKAEKDAAGNVITTHYATKTELAAKRIAVNTTWNNDSVKGEVALVEQGSTSGS